MPPIIKSDKDELDEIIEKASEKVVEKATPKIADSIIEKINSGGKPSSKLSQVLENLRKKEGKEGEPSSQETTEEHTHVHEEVPCPLCSSKEHTHSLKSIGSGKVKCDGDKCGVEYSLIPDNAEYKCETCGLPHKKPVESTIDDKCPFCNGDKFAKYDWSKLKGKKT